MKKTKKKLAANLKKLETRKRRMLLTRVHPPHQINRTNHLQIMKMPMRNTSPKIKNINVIENTAKEIKHTRIPKNKNKVKLL